MGEESDESIEIKRLTRVYLKRVGGDRVKITFADGSVPFGFMTYIHLLKDFVEGKRNEIYFARVDDTEVWLEKKKSR